MTDDDVCIRMGIGVHWVNSCDASYKFSELSLLAMTRPWPMMHAIEWLIHSTVVVYNAHAAYSRGRLGKGGKVTFAAP